MNPSDTNVKQPDPSKPELIEDLPIQDSTDKQDEKVKGGAWLVASARDANLFS